MSTKRPRKPSPSGRDLISSEHGHGESPGSGRSTGKRDHYRDPIVVVCTAAVLMRAADRDHADLLSSLLNNLFLASRNTVDQALKRGREALGIEADRKRPIEFLKEASALGIGESCHQLDAGRRLLEIWQRTVADRRQAEQMSHAAKAERKRRKAMRDMLRAWDEVAEHMDECCNPAPPRRPSWQPDLKLLRDKVEGLGLQFAAIPKDSANLNFPELLKDVVQRCTQGRLQAWQDYLERTRAPAELRAHFALVVEKSELFAKETQNENEIVDAMNDAPPHSTELEEAQEAFLAVIEDLVARLKAGRDRK